MRFGLIFGIIGFLVIGACAYGLMGQTSKAASDAVDWAFLGAVLGFVLGGLLEYKINDETDNPVAVTHGLSLPIAYGIVRETIANYRRGPNMFYVTQDDPQQGKLNATMRFVEQMSLLPPGTLPGQLGPEVRQIDLLVQFLPASTGTEVRLSWRVYAPMNRDTCDSIIDDLTAQIHCRLEQVPV